MRRKFQILVLVKVIGCALLISIFGIGLFFFGPRFLWNPCNEKEFLRRTTGSKLFDAVVVEMNCGALNTNQFIVSVVQKDMYPKAENQVATLDNLGNFDIRWVDDSTLGIFYDEARIHSFKNYYYPHEMKSPDDFIKIIEAQKGIHMEPKFAEKVGITASSNSPLNIEDAALSDSTKTMFKKAREDYIAALNNRKIVNAAIGPEMADGGTGIYKGDGYTLTLVHRYTTIGDVEGILIGPSIKFADSNARDYEVSHIEFYSLEKLRQKK